MFIPINAKADIEDSKKGKLTPAQNAQVNAWTLSRKTGIFNTLGKCTASSVSTPLQNEVTVTFNNGYFVVCGRLVEVEQGTTVKIPLPASGEVEGNIVARFNLSASQEGEFQVLATTGAIVTSDLNANPFDGRYDFVLYRYTANASGVELKERYDSIYIDDVAGNLAKFEQTLYGAGKPLNGYNTSKGTIEQRLTNLGFRQGSTSFANGGSGSATLKRQGNYVIASLRLNSASGRYGYGYQSGDRILYLPEYFRPKDYKQYTIGGVGKGINSSNNQVSCQATFNLVINTAGEVIINNLAVSSDRPLEVISNTGLHSFNIDIGFEAPAITN